MANEPVNTEVVQPSVTLQQQSPAETPVVVTPTAPQTSPNNPAEQQNAHTPPQGKQETAQPVISQDELNSYSTEFYQTGTLSEASFAALEKKGLTREVVQAYIDGQKTHIAQETEELTKGIGGYEQFKKIAEWVGKAIPEAERDAYNEVFKSGNKVAIQAVLEKMNSLYLKANPAPPAAPVEGNPATSAAVPNDVFASRDEMVQAMTDKRYQTGDAAYIRSVTEKIQRSMNAGISLR